jgi:hypothetical protein
MRNKILQLVLPTLIDIMLKSFPEATIKQYLDDLIDLLEVRIEQSRNEIDNLFLPVLVAVRQIFDIPDNP